jgi:hypothetical protein
MRGARSHEEALGADRPPRICGGADVNREPIVAARRAAGCSLLNILEAGNRRAWIMQTKTLTGGGAGALTSDERWAAWVARGVEHDRTTMMRANVAFAVVGTGLVLWLGFVLLFG